MMRIKLKLTHIPVFILFLLFVFQSPLERFSSVFSYIDEGVIVVAVLLMVIYKEKCLSVLKNRKFILAFSCLVIFVLSGLVSNYLYQYQIISLVILDLVANLKFYFAIVAGYLILKDSTWDKTKYKLNKLMVIISYFIFALYMIDCIFNIWGGQVRHGIKSAQLIYLHSTYLAATIAFICAFLAVSYKKRNWIPIVLDLIVMSATLRSKAIVSAACFAFLFWLIIIKKKRLKIWQIIIVTVLGIAVAWKQIAFYYVRLMGASARSIMTITSITILKDFFPLGTGFGTFASHSASVNYSPVYEMYGFSRFWEVSSNNPDAFLDDTFWPIILGQTGIIGSIAYITLLFFIIERCFYIRKDNKILYMSSLFIMAYLLISSMAEPAFNNSIAIPLGFLLGIIFRVDKRKQGESYRL